MRIKRNGLVIYEGPYEGWKGAARIKAPVKDRMEDRLPICQTCPHFTADAQKPCAKERCAGCWEQTVKYGTCKAGKF